MTSRTNDNFRQNFWTWVDPPPPFEQCSKKLHFFERKASLTAVMVMVVNTEAHHGWFLTWSIKNHEIYQIMGYQEIWNPVFLFRKVGAASSCVHLLCNLLRSSCILLLCVLIRLGGGPFQKNKSYPHFLMLWSLYNRYLTLKMVSLQN